MSICICFSRRAVRTTTFSLAQHFRITSCLPLGTDRRCFSTREERQAIREMERADKRARRDAKARKDAETRDYLETLSQHTPENSRLSILKEKQEEDHRIKLDDLKLVWIEERAAIRAEATAITRSLYRRCLRSVQLMRYGNEHDEIEFKRLEAEQTSRWKQALSDGLDGIGSMAPAVDRENELESRYHYYYAHVHERFYGDLHILSPDPWTEEHAECFPRILQDGEDARKYVLEDYKFNDPYANDFDEERIKKLDERMKKLVKDVYREYGWQLDSDLVHDDIDDVEDLGFDVEAPVEGMPMKELREGAKFMIRLEEERAAKSKKS